LGGCGRYSTLTVANGSRLGLKYRISYQTHVTGLENVY
jgi:hypothetical protein